MLITVQMYMTAKLRIEYVEHVHAPAPTIRLTQRRTAKNGGPDVTAEQQKVTHTCKRVKYKIAAVHVVLLTAIAKP